MIHVRNPSRHGEFLPGSGLELLENRALFMFHLGIGKYFHKRATTERQATGVDEEGKKDINIY